MNGNQRGIGDLSRVDVTRAQDIAAYDRLPPLVRAALREASVSISAVAALGALRGGQPAGALVARIAAIDSRARAAWREEAAEACAR